MTDEEVKGEVEYYRRKWETAMADIAQLKAELARVQERNRRLETAIRELARIANAAL